MAATKYNLNTKIRSALRKVYMYYPAKKEALNKAKIDGTYALCAACKKIGFYGSMHVDHIEPVVGSEGFTNWDEYINRMFCSVDNFQVLCIECHNAKTKLEGEERRDKRRALKLAQKAS